jgi:hypothetical protein
MTASAPAPAVLESEETRRYLETTVRAWLGLRVDAEVNVPALPSRLARLLLRIEEHERPERDRWGRWEFDFSENYLAGNQRVAEIDDWIAVRRGELEATTPLEPLWPDGKPFAVCLTHDVDLVSARSTPRQVARHVRAGLARNGGGLLRLARPPLRLARSLRAGVSRAPSARETLERSAALEAHRGAVASYLFTAPPAGGRSRYDCVYDPDDPCVFRNERRSVADVMRLLADDGFDVGLHGSYGAGVRPGALAAERETLRRATGLEVKTTRQHLLHWDVRWTPRLQEDAGLRVDSSLGFSRNVGFRAGTSLPFHHFDLENRRPLDLLEVPLVVPDTALLDVWGLGLELDAASDVVRQLLDSAAHARSAVTLVFHPDKLVRPDWLSLYEWTLDEAAARGAWLTSLHELDLWWRRREAKLLAA